MASTSLIMSCTNGVHAAWLMGSHPENFMFEIVPPILGVTHHSEGRMALPVPEGIKVEGERDVLYPCDYDREGDGEQGDLDRRADSDAKGQVLKTEPQQGWGGRR